MTDTASKRIIIIAGPNGAGKTTFARSFLPEEADLPRFINADAIAAGLAACRMPKLLSSASRCVCSKAAIIFPNQLSAAASPVDWPIFNVTTKWR